MSDWLGNTTTYSYGDPHHPDAPTSITYPASTGLSATYTYDNNASVTGLTAGPITDAWTYNADSQVATTTMNGATSSAVSYNANHRITGAANLATSTGVW